MDHEAHVRPFRPGDEEPILAAMLATLERGELDGVNRHFVEAAARRLPHDPGGCSVAVEAGRVVGWIVASDDDLTVDLPYRRRGHGRRLVEAGRRIARDAGFDALRLWVPRRDGPEAFARACGMRYRSSLWQLRLDPFVAVDPPCFGDELAVRGLMAGTDDQAFVDLVRDTFVDHPWPLRITLEEVRRVHADPGFDPSTLLLVTRTGDPSRLVAFCRVTSYPDDDGTPVGEVKLVGVRRELRGRGIGRELVKWGVISVRARGAERVILAVEGENEGAIKLYWSLGFRQHVEWPHWILPSDGGGSAASGGPG
jgi:mycothiol synthase